MRIRKSNFKIKSFSQNLIGGIIFVLNSKIIFGSLFIVFVNAFFVRGILEIQPTIAGDILLGSSTSLSIITVTAGVGALLSSILMSIRKFENQSLQKLLIPMLIVGFINLMNILMRQHGEKRGAPDQFQ